MYSIEYIIFLLTIEHKNWGLYLLFFACGLTADGVFLHYCACGHVLMVPPGHIICLAYLEVVFELFQIVLCWTFRLSSTTINLVQWFLLPQVILPHTENILLSSHFFGLGKIFIYLFSFFLFVSYTLYTIYMVFKKTYTRSCKNMGYIRYLS